MAESRNSCFSSFSVARFFTQICIEYWLIYYSEVVAKYKHFSYQIGKKDIKYKPHLIYTVYKGTHSHLNSPKTAMTTCCLGLDKVFNLQLKNCLLPSILLYKAEKQTVANPRHLLIGDPVIKIKLCGFASGRYELTNLAFS